MERIDAIRALCKIGSCQPEIRNKILTGWANTLSFSQPLFAISPSKVKQHRHMSTSQLRALERLQIHIRRSFPRLQKLSCRRKMLLV